MNSSYRKPRVENASVRFGKRVPVDVPVSVQVDGRDMGRGTLRNASVSGALLATPLELPLHTNLVVMLPIRGRQATDTHALPACVVRLDPIGLGLEWRDMGSVDVVDLLERAS